MWKKRIWGPYYYLLPLCTSTSVYDCILYIHISKTTISQYYIHPVELTMLLTFLQNNKIYRYSGESIIVRFGESKWGRLGSFQLNVRRFSLTNMFPRDRPISFVNSIVIFIIFSFFCGSGWGVSFLLILNIYL